jgi:UPF0755 protein
MKLKTLRFWAWAMLMPVAAAGLVASYLAFTRSPLALSQPVIVEVPGHSSAIRLMRLLSDAGALRGMEPWYFAFMAWQSGRAGQLQPGEYRLTPGMVPARLLEMMARGQVYQRSVTLVEGWQFRQIVAALARSDQLQHTIEGLSDEAVMAQIGSALPYLEGQVFPDTYFYTRGMSDVALLRRGVLRMQQILAREWSQRAAGLMIQTPEQALILASIIEKETARDDERAKVAGVMHRRLKLGMLLQVDPTVIYGLGSEYHGDIRRSHLLKDTPWNTYTRHGLPPTPIAAPGLASLHAALHPDDSDALYYVSRGDGSGSHVFSATLEAHERAVDQYQRHRSAMPAKP